MDEIREGIVVEQNPIEEIAFVKVESEMNDTNRISMETIEICDDVSEISLDLDTKFSHKMDKTHKVRILQQRVRRQTKRIEKLESLLKKPKPEVKPRVYVQYVPHSFRQYRSLSWKKALSIIKTTEQNTCRLCIAPLSNKRIYNKGKTAPFDDNELPLNLTELNIKRDDGLPQEICRKCFNFLNDIRTFYRQAKRSQEILRKHFHTAIIDIEIKRLGDDWDLLDNGTDREETPSPQFLEENEFTKKDEDLIGMPLNSTGADVVSEILPDDNGVPTVVETIPLNEDNFSNEIEDEKIVETKTIDPKLYCTICDKVFRSKQSKKNHMEQHTGNTYECDICKRIFNRKCYLRRHMRKHSTKILTCSICNRKFTDPYRYRYHLKSHKPKRFNCKYCEKSFLQLGHLTNHENMHSGISPHLCPICGSTFRLETSYLLHMSKHSYESGLINVKTYNCNKCEKIFGSKSSFYIHQRFHTKPIICDICDMRFAQRVQIRMHMIRMHSGIPDGEKKRRNVKAGLMRDDPERQHICTICDHAFKRPYVLKKHIQAVHLKEKPFECTVCRKWFSQSHSLKEHMASHSYIRPFACDFCPSRFRTKRVLNGHIILTHDISQQY